MKSAVDTLAPLIWLVGLVLIAMSFFWPALVGGRQVWSESQADGYSQAAAELHTLTYQAASAVQNEKKRGTGQNSTLGQLQLAPDAGAADPSRASADRLVAQRNAAQAKYDQARTALEDARSHGQGAALMMRWAGIAAILGGLVFWAIARPAATH